MSERDQYLIDIFLQGKLTDVETKEFESRKNDKEFLEAIEFTRVLSVSIEGKRKEELLEKAKELELGFSKKTKRNYFLMTIFVLVLVAALFLIGKSLILPKDQLPNIADYIQPFENTYYPIKRNDDPDTDILKAFTAYENGDYQLSKNLLAAFAESNSGSIKFYEGVSNFMLSEWTSADQLFAEVLESISEYAIPAKWYQALSKIQLGENDKAKVLLKEVENQKEYTKLSRDAQQLLSEME